MRLSVVEVADKLSTDKETARGFIKFLVQKGLAELMGERKPEGPGKPEHVYIFNDDFEETLSAMLRRARLT